MKKDSGPLKPVGKKVSKGQLGKQFNSLRQQRKTSPSVQAQFVGTGLTRINLQALSTCKIVCFSNKSKSKSSNNRSGFILVLQ